jgi:hypothetical protein
VPIHRAKCTEPGCEVGAMYRPSATGAGFQILERYGVAIETTFGIGPNGIPLCPLGHGELGLADDLLPAADAIAEAAGKVERSTLRQPRLPGVLPQFNFEGTVQMIFDTEQSVCGLEREAERLHERYKEAKKAAEVGQEKLRAMIRDYRDRKQEREFEIERQRKQDADGHPDDTNLVRCRYEQQNPGQTCPVCTSGATFVRGQVIAARDSDRHVDQVAEFLEDLETERLVENLVEPLAELAGIVVTLQRIREWAPAEREEVDGYLAQLRAGGVKSIKRPSVFGTSHLAAAVEDGAKVQPCKECGTTLLVFGESEEDPQPYAPGTLVGADCTAGEIEPHRYPARQKKTGNAKAEKPAKAKKTGKKR